MVDVDRSQLSLAIPNGRDIASNPREWPLSGFFFFFPLKVTYQNKSATFPYSVPFMLKDTHFERLLARIQGHRQNETQGPTRGPTHELNLIPTVLQPVELTRQRLLGKWPLV